MIENLFEVEITIRPTIHLLSNVDRKNDISIERRQLLGATEVNSKASRMKDGEVCGRKGLEEREREREREESKAENREGTRYPPDFMAPRRRSLKVRYRRDDDVESCLVPISIINTMKNNREREREREKASRNVWSIWLKKIVFLP